MFVETQYGLGSEYNYFNSVAKNNWTQKAHVMYNEHILDVILNMISIMKKEGYIPKWDTVSKKNFRLFFYCILGASIKVFAYIWSL